MVKFLHFILRLTLISIVAIVSYMIGGYVVGEKVVNFYEEKEDHIKGCLLEERANEQLYERCVDLLLEDEVCSQ